MLSYDLSERFQTQLDVTYSGYLASPMLFRRELMRTRIDKRPDSDMILRPGTTSLALDSTLIGIWGYPEKVFGLKIVIRAPYPT